MVCTVLGRRAHIHLAKRRYTAELCEWLVIVETRATRQPPFSRRRRWPQRARGLCVVDGGTRACVVVATLWQRRKVVVLTVKGGGLSPRGNGRHRLIQDRRLGGGWV